MNTNTPQTPEASSAALSLALAVRDFHAARGAVRAKEAGYEAMLRERINRIRMELDAEVKEERAAVNRAQGDARMRLVVAACEANTRRAPLGFFVWREYVPFTGGQAQLHSDTVYSGAKMVQWERHGGVFRETGKLGVACFVEQFDDVAVGLRNGFDASRYDIGCPIVRHMKKSGVLGVNADCVRSAGEGRFYFTGGWWPYGISPNECVKQVEKTQRGECDRCGVALNKEGHCISCMSLV